MSKKILSVLLAALLLASCVAGVLMTGGSAVQDPTVIWTAEGYTEEGAKHFSTIQAALSHAASLTWGKDDVLEIRFKGEQVSAGAQGTFDSEGNIDSMGTQGLLFGQTTIWREDGTKLPITIRGIDIEEPRDSWIYIDSAGGWYACANDYTFVNLTRPVGNYGTHFFAGSGNVTFHECNLSFPASTRIVISNMEEWQEKSLISTDLSEYIAKTYDVDIIPVNNAAQIVVNESEAFSDETLGHLLFAAQRSNGLDYGDWTHEGDIGGGQYLYACVLFETLTKMSCVGNTFRPTYGLKYDDMTFEELQEIAHQAVEEQYGEGYCTGVLPKDIGGDNVFNLLLVGSSNAYYCIDELASIARAAGVDMKVYHAYASSVQMWKMASSIADSTAVSYSMQIWYDADGTGAVKSGSNLHAIEDIVTSTDFAGGNWDAAVTFETSGKIDDFGLDPDNHEAQMAQVIDQCEGVAGVGDVPSGHTAGGAKEMYAFLTKNCNADTRMLWYETSSSPIGAYGSTTTLKGYLFGDNCTDAAFIGWDRYEGDTIKTGITLGDNVTYIDTSDNATIRVAASGYLFGQTDTALTDETAANVTYHASGADGTTDIRPIQVEPSITIDGSGAAVYNVSTKLGGSPCNATVYLKKGTVNGIFGDNCTDQSGDADGTGENFYGDMNAVVTGGTLKNIYMTWDSYVTGDINITVNKSDGSTFFMDGGNIRAGFGAGTKTGYATGDVTLDIKDVNVPGVLWGGGGVGKAINKIENTTIGGSFFGSRIQNCDSVINTLTNVSVGATSYCGTYGYLVRGDVRNTLIDCTFLGDCFAGNNSGIIQGSIYNTLKNTSVKGNFYGGNNLSVINGSITNEIQGGTFEGTFYGGTKSNNTTNTDGSYKRNDTIGGQIINKIDGTSFTGSWTYLGSDCAWFADSTAYDFRMENTISNITANRLVSYSGRTELDGSIQNTYRGINDILYFYSGANNKNITGTIENHFEGKIVHPSGMVCGGSNSANVGKIVNYVKPGAHLGKFYAGLNSVGSTTYTVGTIENYLLGGKIDSFYGAGNVGTVTTVTTTVGDTESHTVPTIGVFYGGGNGAAVTTVNTTVYGGIFEGAVSKSGAKGTITNTPTLDLVVGDEYLAFFGEATLDTLTGNGVIHVGKDAKITVSGSAEGTVAIEQMEIWENETYFTAQDANLTITIVDEVPGSASVQSGSVIGTATASETAAPVSARLLLDSRVGVKLYFNKEDITEDFSYKVTMLGNTTYEAEGSYEDLIEEDGYFALVFTGIGLDDFATEFVLRGDSIYDENSANYNTIVELADLGADSSEEYHYKKLFEAIADLGRVKENPSSAIHGLSYSKVNPKSSGQGAESGAAASFKGKNLLMSDAMGIRLYGVAESAEAAQNLQLIVNGDQIRKDYYDVTITNESTGEFTLDIYISVSMMDTELSIEIRDAADKLCLKLCDRVDWITQMIINNEPDNMLAKQVLIYIQKTNNYINDVTYVTDPSEPGTETPIGDKVEVFD